MSIIQLDAILMIGLFVATSGFAIAQVFEQLKRPYLFTIFGSRTRLLAARGGVWSMAILVSVLAWSVLFAVLPGFTALALFFAFEAIVLDICSQRIQFVRLTEAELISASTVSLQTASSAFQADLLV